MQHSPSFAHIARLFQKRKAGVAVGDQVCHSALKPCDLDVVGAPVNSLDCAILCNGLEGQHGRGFLGVDERQLRVDGLNIDIRAFELTEHGIEAPTQPHVFGGLHTKSKHYIEGGKQRYHQPGVDIGAFDLTKGARCGGAAQQNDNEHDDLVHAVHKRSTHLMVVHAADNRAADVFYSSGFGQLVGPLLGVGFLSSFGGFGCGLSLTGGGRGSSFSDIIRFWHGISPCISFRLLSVGADGGGAAGVFEALAAPSWVQKLLQIESMRNITEAAA